MKRLTLLLMMILAVTVSAVAQDAKQPAPKLLTPQQVSQLAEAEKTLAIAQAEAALAAERVAKLQAQIQILVREFFIQNGIDGKRYDTQLKVIDEKSGQIGFQPKKN